MSLIREVKERDIHVLLSVPSDSKIITPKDWFCRLACLTFEKVYKDIANRE